MQWTTPAPGIDVPYVVVDERHKPEESPVMKPTTIGLDLGKNALQIHGIDAEGRVVVRKQLRRRDVLPLFANLSPCLIGLEACATAHYWARELAFLGHEVRLMPPSYVKPYVKRGKNDAVDAEAICEAVTRPTMRFVPVKSAEQQSVLMLHRTRDLLIRQRTSLVNALRGHLAEIGIVVPQGMRNVAKLVAVISDGDDERVPNLMRTALGMIIGQLQDLQVRLRSIDAEIIAWHRTNSASRRLETIPGVGPITASAIAATVTDPSHFRSGRQFAAWIGLTPRQSSTGGKARLVGISKMGDRYIRRLLVLGATALIRYARARSAAEYPWLGQLLERRPARLASVAAANKMARVAWALLARNEVYSTAPTATAT
jgi:transposase